MHAMETFAQLYQLGRMVENVIVADAPDWPHRGLMVDAGRRFLPIPLLEALVDGLSYSKMNVLHLHLSDEPAMRLESKLFPELTAALPPGSFYTPDDMRSFVAYAAQRGVRVVPEIDVPAHAGGLAPLVKRGLKYCDAAKTTLAADAGTLAVLDKLFGELVTVFSDEVIHFGADEACKHDECPAGCTYDDVHKLEKHMQTTIRALGKTPMGWNDVFSDPKGSTPNVRKSVV